jgi:hypothetical protein
MPAPSFGLVHIVYKWGAGNGGFTFECSSSGYYGKQPFNGTNPGIVPYPTVYVPIDPLTAIGLGLVSPDELGYPAGLLAAFNIMKGN